MSFTDAIKRPFQDLKKLIIGIIISIIPIVNFIGIGYYLECAKTTLKKNNTMPEWNNWLGLFMKGLGVLVISLIYAIPAIIALILTVGMSILTGGLTALMSTGTLAAINTLTTLGLGLLLTLIVAIIMSLISTAAVIRYAEKDSFGAAFELSAVIKKAFTGTFFSAWLLSVIYTVVVLVILSFIPIIGTGIAIFISGVTMYTFVAEAYKKV